MSSTNVKTSRYESRRQIKRAIKSRLGVMNFGEPLPPVRSLMREYGTSITRLNRIFGELAKEGLIDRRPGAGIFKANLPIESLREHRKGQLQSEANCLRVVVLLDSWPDGGHSFGANLFGLMRQRALRATKKYRLVCEVADFATHGREEFDRLIESDNVDAVVAMPYSQEGLELVQSYQSNSKPVLCFFRHVDNPHIPSIYVDHYQGACQAGSHLCILGHKRIGFLGLPLALGNPAWDRERGFRDALQAYGYKVDPNLILHVEHNHQDICAAVHRLLSLDDPITALFTADGLLVTPALHALAEAGKRIPDDISLLCYDDVPECRTYRTPISVVRQPLEHVVEALLQEIVAHVEHRDEKRHDVAVPPELVLRSSCRPGKARLVPQTVSDL